MTAIIYAFRSPGSGAVYIGKHQCDPEGWPRRGNGRLPDGYGGSGVAVRNFHRRHGDRVEWRILATVTGDRDAVNAAERRAIRLARALFGRACVNRLDGGDGLTREEAQALNRRNVSDPKWLARQRETLAAWRSSPEGREAMGRALAKAHTNPDAVARRDAALARWNASPEGRAHLQALVTSPAAREQRQRALAKARLPEAKAKADAGRAAWNASAEGKAQLAAALTKARQPEFQAKARDTLAARCREPDARERLARAAKIGHRKRRARKALAPFLRSGTALSSGTTFWPFHPGSPITVTGYEP